MRGDKLDKVNYVKHEHCDICLLEISVSEHVLMHVGYDIDQTNRVRDYKERKKHCDTYHKNLRELEKKRLYSYPNAFSKDLVQVNLGKLIQIK